MTHEHAVVDMDRHFTIDPETMVISCEGEVKALRQGDHAAERYTFDMPRFIEGHDMSLCNAVQAHYNNTKYDKPTRTTTENKSFDSVEDFGIVADDESKVSFSWLIQGDATQLDGTMNFCIRFACVDDAGEVTYQKFTEVFEGVPVGETIYNSEAIANEYADVLVKWREEMLSDIEKAGLVKTVNGKSPDKNGNIEVVSAARIANIVLDANSWTGSNNLYSQIVSVDGVTKNSQVDLTPSVEQLVVFYEKDLTLVTENENGVVTVYAIGQKPTNNYTVQATITEVSL